MPALSPTMEEGTLTRWFLKEGDSFEMGQPLAEIETDKTALELEASEPGVLDRILVPDGTESIPVGAVIATFHTAASAQAIEERKPALPIEAAPTPLGSQDHPSPRDPKHRSGPIKRASPLAKRLAHDFQIDLSRVDGTGPNGRVLMADVQRARRTPPGARAEGEAASGASRPDDGADVTVPHTAERLSSMRRVIAERMSHAKRTIPHAYLSIDVVMEKALELKASLNSGKRKGAKYSLNDVIVRAMALSLAAEPRANVQFVGDRLLRFSRVDLSVAVSVEGGLLTPVVIAAETKSLTAISAELHDLISRARGGKLRPEEYAGGTASLTNLGMMGVKHFEAIINPPHGLVLAVGTAQKRAVVLDDKVVIAHVLTATAGFDHRAMDGEVCANFLNHFREHLEKPASVLL